MSVDHFNKNNATDTTTDTTAAANSSSIKMLPPSAYYDPRKYVKGEIVIYDRNFFESYMNQPKLLSRAASSLRYITHNASAAVVIDKTAPIPTTADFGPDSYYYLDHHHEIKGPHYYYFGFEEWENMVPESYFWTQWAGNLIRKGNGGDCDGLWSFANNLIWMRHRAAVGAQHQKMYIAYLSMTSPHDDINGIVTAVCVFVQPNGVYFTLGITKNNIYKNAFKGSSVKLQQYIAHIIHTKVDPHTLGLLFRPNKLMRDIMLHSISETLVGGADVYIGSNWDKWWCEKHRKTWRGDNEPSIIQSYENGITLPCVEMDDSGAMAYFVANYRNTTDQKRTMTISTPFWESPSLFCNPDSPNNPQLPMLFVPIKTLLLWCASAL